MCGYGHVGSQVVADLEAWGGRCVVVEVDPDGTLRVARLEDEPDELLPLPAAEAPRLPAHTA